MLDNTSTLDGGWMTEEVALAQRELIERELARDPLDDHFQVFLRAVETILERDHPQQLLDVGCGNGHYGTVLKRYHPYIEYTGIDLSPFMVAQAKDREPLLTFATQGLLHADLWRYDSDIVLASQVLEMMSDPWIGLERLLREARGWLILHKLRLTDTSHWIEEDTYMGHRGRIYLWRGTEILSWLDQFKRRAITLYWSRNDIITLVIEPSRRP